MSGIVNDSSTPAEYPNNVWTQMIEATRQRNQQGASMPPEPAGVPNVGTPMPAVRSAELGRPVQENPNRDLSHQEIEELNRLAIQSGMVRGPVNPGIARTLEGVDDLGPYATMEDAIAAGAPVGADEQAIIEGAAQFREPGPTPVTHIRTPIGGQRQTTREFIAAQPQSSLPRLPDFKKVQMIDMVNGKVYVDGLEFSLQPAQVKMLRKFCVTTAKEQIEKSLTAALAELAEDTDGGTAAE